MYQISAEADNFDILHQICPKRVFPVVNGKVALVRGSMIVTYYIKLLLTVAERHNSILMSFLLLVAETMKWAVQLRHKIN